MITAEYRIFNELSGRFLASNDNGYLTFSHKVFAEFYIKEKNLNPEFFKVKRVRR
ncbi:MAG: hypothetical protein ACI4I9_08130 [Porcipelethomonas sp.]